MNTDPIRVLLIEDDLDDALLLKESLAEANAVKIKLTHAERLSEGLKRITEQEFDVILLDLNLPDSRGLETLNLVIKESSKIPVVVLSGLADDYTTVEAVRQGAQDYLVKGEINGSMLGRVLRYAIERKQAEKQLRQAEENYRVIFENSLTGIFRSTPEGRYIMVNPALARILGYDSPEDMLASVTDTARQIYVDPDRRVMHTRLLKEKGGDVTGFEYEAYRKDGATIWVSENVRSVVDANGALLYYEGAVEDISERKQAEQQMQTLLEAIPDGVLVVNLEGNIIIVNAQIEALFGYRGEELLDQPIEMLLPERNRAIHPKYRGQYHAAPKTRSMGSDLELYARRKDGSEFPVDISLSAIETKRGWMAISVIRDITKRKQAERKLYESEVRHRSLVEGTPGIVYTFSMTRGGIYYSSHVADILGYSPEYLYAHPMLWHDSIHPNDRSRVDEIIQQIPTMRTFRLEYRICDAQGNWHWFDDRSFAFHDGEEETLVDGLAIDITESKQAEEALQQRAHELQTLYETSLEISSQASLDPLLSSIVERAASLLNTSSGGLYLMEPDGGSLKLVVGHNLPKEYIGVKLRLGEGLSGRVAQSGKPLVVEDYRAWSERAKVYSDTPFRRVLGIPLKIKDRVIGVINVTDFTRTGSFSEEEVRLVNLFADQAALAIENARLFKHAERRLQRTESLHAIDIAIAGSMDINLVFNVIFDQAFSQLSVDAAVVLLYNPAAKVLGYATGRGFRTEALQHTRLPLGEGYAGRVALGRQMVHIADLQTRKTDFLRSPTFHQEGFVSYFGVPLIAQGEIKGVLEVFQRTAFEADTEWLGFLETLAGQAAIAIDNATLFKSLQLSNIELGMAYDATIEGWSRAMDLKDKETQNHTLRVTSMTERLARAMGIGDADLIHIHRGALLHDIGKMGVPDSILLKPDKLTDEEWAVMRQHPQFAHDMLEPIAYLRPAMNIPYCHHEKWDGSGYPQGLKGEQIPLAARIFAVVDVYDALTSDRPYRPAWTKEETLVYIRKQSGAHFEPSVVDFFLKMMQDDQGHSS